jgi:hypothetical protein
MRVDWVSAGIPFSPKRLQDTTLRNKEPTLLASLYGTSFHGTHEKNVETISPTYKEKSFHETSNAAHYNVEKTQPLIFCSTDLLNKQNESYRFPCKTSNTLNPSWNVIKPKVLTKLLPLKQDYTNTLERPWRRESNSIEYESFIQNDFNTLKKSNHVTKDPVFKDGSKKMKEQMNQLRRSYFRLALELSKLCTKWYRHTLKEYFIFFYSQLKRVNKRNLTSQLATKSSCCLRHIGNRRLMASVLFKNIMILILSPKKLKLIGFCCLLRHSIKSSHLRRESCTNVSNFEAFQLERGVQCMQRVLLRICLKKFQLTCIVTWREIRPLIQQVTHLVQRHLESDRSCDTVTSSISTDQTSKVACESINENKAYQRSNESQLSSNDLQKKMNEKIDQNSFDIPVMVCAKSLSTCETFPYTLSSESMTKTSTQLLPNEQLVTDISFTSHVNEKQLLHNTPHTKKEKNQFETLSFSKLTSKQDLIKQQYWNEKDYNFSRETKTPHFLASCQSTQQKCMTYENSYLSEMCQGDYFVKYHRKNGKPSWRYIWVRNVLK